MSSFHWATLPSVLQQQSHPIHILFGVVLHPLCLFLSHYLIILITSLFLCVPLMGAFWRVSMGSHIWSWKQYCVVFHLALVCLWPLSLSSCTHALSTVGLSLNLCLLSLMPSSPLCVLPTCAHALHLVSPLVVPDLIPC